MSDSIIGHKSPNSARESIGNISPTLQIVCDNTSYHEERSGFVILVPDEAEGITMDQLREDSYWKMENPVVCQMLFGLLWDLNVIHVVFGISYNNFDQKGISISSIRSKGIISYELVDANSDKPALIRHSKVYKTLPLLLTLSNFDKQISLRYLSDTESWDEKIPNLLQSPPEEGFVLFGNREELLPKWFFSRDLWLLGVFILQTFVLKTPNLGSLLVIFRKGITKVIHEHQKLFSPIISQSTSDDDLLFSISPVFLDFLLICLVNEHLGNGLLPGEKCLLGSGKHYQRYYHCCKLLNARESRSVKLHHATETILNGLDIHAKSLLTCLLKWDPLQRSGVNNNILTTCIPVLLNFPYFSTLCPSRTFFNTYNPVGSKPVKRSYSLNENSSNSYTLDLDYNMYSDNRNGHFRFPAIINQ